MPSTTRTLDPPGGLSTLVSEIARLNSLIAKGKRIRPADVDDIRELYQIWIAHTHSHYDQIFIKFGNSPGQPGTSGASRTSSPVKGAIADTTPIQAGSAEYKNFSTQVFELITNFNNYVHEHFHEVEDVG